MGAFHYVAIDVHGRQHKGILDGDHPRQVRAQLREQGLTPLEVEEVRQRESRVPRLSVHRPGLPGRALALLTRQLSTMLRAGVPVEEALVTVARQTENNRARNLLSALRSQVAEGQSLAQAMRRFPQAFPADYVATVAAGEQSGRLELVLERLADYTENRQDLQRQLVTAMIYPALLTVTAFVIVAALLAYVVPQVVDVFTGMHQQLPLLTRLMIAASDLLRHYGLYVLLLVIVLLVLGRYLLRSPERRMAWHRLLLRVPLLGRLLIGANTARFTRTLSILIGSGVPVLEALQISAQVLSNLPMRQAVMEAAGRVREGASIFQSLNRTSYFPPMTLHLIASGESSGRLEDMLERAAVMTEREQSAWVDTMVRILEPLLILMMGGMVLLIVVAIMLPVFSLNRMVG